MIISNLMQPAGRLSDPCSCFGPTDWDECASQAENDCSVFAECINLMGSYMCRCKTTMDTNPSRSGRNCEGEKKAGMKGFSFAMKHGNKLWGHISAFRVSVYIIAPLQSVAEGIYI